MTDEEKKAWEEWVNYCRKVKAWYTSSASDVARFPELEPWAMRMPPEVIVDAIIAADKELHRRAKEG